MGTHYAHLTETDRMSIQALLQAKLSGPEIARQLDFSHSTINRELDGTREIWFFRTIRGRIETDSSV